MAYREKKNQCYLLMDEGTIDYTGTFNRNMGIRCRATGETDEKGHVSLMNACEAD